KAEGVVGWLELFGFPILDESGKATGVVEYVHDITERKRAEEALRESESRYSTLFTGITDAVLVHHITDDGRPGEFIDVNDVACKMLGYTRNELLGMGVGHIDAPESTVDVGRIVEDLKVGRDVLFEQTHVAKDGRRIPVEVHAQALDYKGRLAVLSTVRDMTERKSTEEALRQSEERYRALFENSIDPIYVTTREGAFLDVNQSWLDLFGYTREEMIGLNAQKIYVDPDERSRFQRQIEQEGSVRNYEVKFRKKDGTEMACLITATVRQASDGSILGYQGVMRDITESKRIQAQLQQATKMEAIGTLAGGIAHDFNNLLMGIQGRTSLMLTDVSSDHPHFAHLTGIEDMVKRGADLSRQLLGFARGGKYAVKATDLNDLIEKSSEMFGRTKREIKVHGKYEKEIWTVEVDRGQIEQVLLNLYVNAWQAMPGGGDLYLETRNIVLDKNFTKPFRLEPGNYVHLSVTDTGVGMDEATKNRVFEPFFSTKERGGGTGLGLASAYGIIKNHGGIINVQSELGHGTAIDIYLPASEKEVTGEEEPSVDILEGTETVLLVDDEDVILDVGKEMLATLGYRVMLATSGKQAIALYKENGDKIDLVILDMIMPDMGGGETYDRLKEMNPKVRVLLSSGYSIDGQADQILQRGCDGFIQKPFDMKRLSRAVRGTLEKA
ncbi:MAG: PAS domain S-box protein, partial [Thermodesulfobacteriota bacterium]|nr:PAS domain S-box protein [Thermodesulfobacteriota bacterium]